jgi:uncharacterized protein
MTVDYIRYDILTQTALRGVVRAVLVDAAKKGLPGDHHFKITFGTAAPGVRLSDRMRARYPQDMTVVLQHQFWDLVVTDTTFEVGLSFGGVPERITVPFEAVSAFFDPSVQFGFQFEPIEPAADDAGGAAQTVQKPASAAARPAAEEKKLEALPTPRETATPAPAPENGGGGSGGEVVRLDRFRKK